MTHESTRPCLRLELISRLLADVIPLKLTCIDRNAHLDLPGSGFILKKEMPLRRILLVFGIIPDGILAYGPHLHGYI